MNVKHRCHVKALSENLELGLIGGLLASGVDALWVVMDSYHNGITWYYVVIFSGLFLSSVGLTVALVRHHKANFKHQLGLMFIFKRNVCKAKSRKIRHSGLPIKKKSNTASN